MTIHPRDDETETMWDLPSFGPVTLHRVSQAQARIVCGAPTRDDVKLVGELLMKVFRKL